MRKARLVLLARCGVYDMIYGESEEVKESVDMKEDNNVEKCLLRLKKEKKIEGIVERREVKKMQC